MSKKPEEKDLANIVDIVQSRYGVTPMTREELDKFDPADGNQLQRFVATVLANAIEESDERTDTKIQDAWNAIKRLEEKHGDSVLRARGIELIGRPNPVDRANGAFLLDPTIAVETIRSLAAEQMPGTVRGTKGSKGIYDLVDLNNLEIKQIKDAGLMDVEMGVWSGTHPDYRGKGFNPGIVGLTPREYYRQHGIHVRADETTTTLAYFVPVLYGSLIYTYAWEANPFRAGGATVMNVSQATGKMPLLTAGYTAAVRTEGSSGTAQNLTDAQLSYTCLNYSVDTIVTKDILAEADIGATMTQLIIRELGKAMGTLESYMGINGNGTTAWTKGLAQIAAAKIHSETFAVATILDSFIKADGELGGGVKDASWRTGAGWMIPGRGETVLKLLKDNEKRYVFPPNQEINSLLGKPLMYNENCYSSGKSTAFEYVRPLFYIIQIPKLTTLVFDDKGRTNTRENEAVFFLNMKTDGMLATYNLSKTLQAAVKVTDIA